MGADTPVTSVRRREALAAVSAGGALAVAGCLGGGSDPGTCELTIEKETVGLGEFVYGDQAVYAFEICNEGDGECSGPLVVTEDLPPGTSFVSATGDWTQVSTGPLELENDAHGGIAPGDCIDFEVTVSVGSASAVGDSEGTNCAELYHDGDRQADTCVSHPFVDPEECPPSTHPVTTGWDESAGTVVPTDPQDVESADDWRILQDPQNIASVPRLASIVHGGSYFDAPFPDSTWISHHPGGDSWAGDVFVFEHCFCLRAGFYDPELSLRIQARDEVVGIDLNGTSLSYSGTGSQSGPPIEESYTDPSLFQAGENCLTVTVENVEGDRSGLNLVGTMWARDADCDCEQPEPSCDLSVTKTVDDPFTYDSQGTYSIEICNDGDAPCTGPLTVEDDLPDGVTFASAGGTGWSATVSGGVVVATNDTYGTLAPGECLTLTITVDVGHRDEIPDPEVDNCVTLSHDGSTADSDCLTHTIESAPAGCQLTLEKDIQGPFHYGDSALYTFEICNVGDAACDGDLYLEDDLPDGISFDQMGAGMTGPVSNGVVEATVHYDTPNGSLAPGECLSRSFSVTVTDQAAFPGSGTITNCADLEHDGTPMASDCVTHTVTADDDG